MAASLLPQVGNVLYAYYCSSAVLLHPVRGPSYTVTGCNAFGHLYPQLWFLIALTSVRRQRQCTMGHGSAGQG